MNNNVIEQLLNTVSLLILNAFLEAYIIVIDYWIIVFAVIVIGYWIMSHAIEKESISILFPITKIYQIEKWQEVRTAQKGICGIFVTLLFSERNQEY